MRRLVCVCALAVFSICDLCAGPLLYSVGPDSSGVPRDFTSITGTGVATPLFKLGDGSLGFNGGLAFDPAANLFYGIANDSFGNSSLVSFSLGGGGAFTNIGSLGQGFFSGLAYDTTADQFFAIATDSTGQSSLNSVSSIGGVTPVGVLGTGFNGGLTFRPSDGLLYAFSADSSGVQRQFQAINPATAAAMLLFTAGDGSATFNGGVAYDAASDRFFVIANDSMGVSTLESFTLAGSGTLTPISGIGGGYGNVALALAPEPVPEPSTWLIIAPLVIGLVLRARRTRQS